jgi:lipoate-protein ligase A
MPMPRVILFPSETAPGAAQMARDRWLLTDGPDGCAVRLYAWNPPCLSLGHFQNQVPDELPGMPPHDVVRRVTGGGAIFHDREITYAIAGAMTHPALAGTMPQLYARINRAWIAALRDTCGVTVTERGGAISSKSLSSKAFACFADEAPSDLVVAQEHGGGKILGSAARETAGRRLVHGSLLTGRNPLAPAAPCLADLMPNAAVDRDALLAPLGEAFAAALSREAFDRDGAVERLAWPDVSSP